MDVAFEKDDANFWLEQLEDQITIPEIQETIKKIGMEDYISNWALLNLKCTPMQNGSSKESLVRRYKFVAHICLDSI